MALKFLYVGGLILEKCHLIGMGGVFLRREDGTQMLNSVKWKQCFFFFSQKGCSGPYWDTSLVTQICRQAAKEDKRTQQYIRFSSFSLYHL